MPGDHVHDEIRYKPKADRLYLTKLRIGKTQITSKANGSIEVATGIQLYIPIPQKVTDTASWFFSMSNRKGTCFAKITEEDLEAMSEMMLEARTSNKAQDALQTARIRIEAIKKTMAIVEGEEEPPLSITNVPGGSIITKNTVINTSKDENDNFVTKLASIETGEIYQEIEEPDSLIHVTAKELIAETKIRKEKKKDKKTKK